MLHDVEEGIRTSGRKAELVARIQANNTYQADIAGIAKMGVSNTRRGSSGYKRGASHNIEGSTKKHKGERAEDTAAIDAVFELFRDPESTEASITDDGILALCDALGIDAQDPMMLALSCTMEAESMCVYTKAEFRRGMLKLNCRSLEALRSKVPLLRSQLHDYTEFATIYSVRDVKDPTQKSLALDLAVGLWDLLLPGHFHWRRHWIQFVRKNSRNVVARDLWLQVLDFGHQIKPDLSNFDENGAWPVLLDDFASHMQELIAKHGQAAVQHDEDTMAADEDNTDTSENMVIDE
ncbi:hypothetical protein BBJ29_009642 [Phytophthora kernoviae]|uniref:Defective in cullin neddylation protein n=1 Tax=Phytophthora kernoviae TaxID=325452 RepID=A0A3F2RBP1_9STRA|nr:hypothetical protein BBJ29_009642 [Phytophthora kernoviae]RLN51957.1 hypothetical protein BBP00_00009782 [Phytophthora kernoviae]